MSKAYSQYKVNELKEILRERSLPLNGTKSELIARLEEHDATSKEKSTSTEPSEPVKATEEEVAAVPSPAKVSDAEAKTEKKSLNAKTSDAVEAEKPDAAEPSTVSDNESLARIKADIELQIKRVNRFGGDAKELEQRLKRINKFGMSAIKDALAKSEPKLEHRKKFHRSKIPKKAA